MKIFKKLGILVASLGLFTAVGCSKDTPSTVAVTGITTTESSVTVEVGESHSLVYTINPEEATNKEVTFTTESNLITLEGNVVTGVAEGSASVVATTVDGGFTVTYTVTVVHATTKVFPAEDIVSFFSLAEIEVNVPSYAVASSEAYFEIHDEYVLDYGIFEVRVFNSSATEMTTYSQLMGNNGWDIKAGQYAGDYVATFGETNAVVELQDWISYTYGCIRIICYVSEPVVFPSEEIATDLAEAGVTDVLPVFSGEALGYDYYSEDGERQLMIAVTSGTETVAISTYQSDLLGSSYTEAGKDTYGDMHYTSPNGQLDICVWNGADIDYSGYVFVDIVVK